MESIVVWYLRIRPEKISWLRFILEGYDATIVETFGMYDEYESIVLRLNSN